MRENGSVDNETNQRFREATLGVILNSDREGSSALEGMFDLAEEERDLGVRFTMFQAYAKRFPKNRSALINRLNGDDIRYAEEHRTRRNR